MKRFIGNRRGSASLEFVVLAIPLFLPILIFMKGFSESSDAQVALRSLAREGARAYVLSANDEIANQVAAKVIAVGAEAMGYKESIRFLVRCSQKPCIYPNGRVSISVIARLQNSDEVEVTAIEYVSPWS